MSEYNANEMRLGKVILDSAHKIRLVLNSRFENDELTGPQARILSFLIKRSARNLPVYQKDIEREFKISRSSVTSVLNNMEKNGFILRQAVESDARLKKIALTEKARKSGIENKTKLDNFEAKLMDGFTRQEMETLTALLDKAVKNLNNQK